MATAAGRLAGMAANSTADRSQGVRLAGVSVGFFKTPLRDERNIAPRLGVNWTRLHAGKGRFQPVQVHEFGRLLKQLAAPPHLLFARPGLPLRRFPRPGCRSKSVTTTRENRAYLETVRFTEVESPDTVTDWVEGLPSSLQLFRV